MEHDSKTQNEKKKRIWDLFNFILAFLENPVESRFYIFTYTFLTCLLGLLHILLNVCLF